MAGRRAGRRTALFLLYQWDVTGQPLTSLYEGEVDAFARELAEAVTARAPELDAAITAAAEGWTADRLGAIERNVLRIGTQALERAQVLLERLEAARQRLETTEDAEAAVEVMSELAEIARQIETELAEARRRAEEDAREEP